MQHPANHEVPEQNETFSPSAYFEPLGTVFDWEIRRRRFYISSATGKSDDHVPQ